MAGRDAVYPGTLPQHVSPFFDWTYAHVGDVQPQGGDVRHAAYGDPEEGGHALLAFRDGVLTGANLINCTHLAGRLKSAILRRSHADARGILSGDGVGPASVDGIFDGWRPRSLDDRPRGDRHFLTPIGYAR
jgi:hypothetical protein